MPHRSVLRVTYGRLLLFHGARMKPYELCFDWPHTLLLTWMYAHRPSVTVSYSPPARPNHSEPHIGLSPSVDQLPTSYRCLSIVKSQYGSATRGLTACMLCSNASESAMCCVRKPSPSCMWSHRMSDAS